jgi:hypothetical protein
MKCRVWRHDLYPSGAALRRSDMTLAAGVNSRNRVVYLNISFRMTDHSVPRRYLWLVQCIIYSYMVSRVTKYLVIVRRLVHDHFDIAYVSYRRPVVFGCGCQRTLFWQICESDWEIQEFLTPFQTSDAAKILKACWDYHWFPTFQLARGRHKWQDFLLDMCHGKSQCAPNTNDVTTTGVSDKTRFWTCATGKIPMCQHYQRCNCRHEWQHVWFWTCAIGGNPNEPKTSTKNCRHYKWQAWVTTSAFGMCHRNSQWTKNINHGTPPTVLRHAQNDPLESKFMSRVRSNACVASLRIYVTVTFRKEHGRYDPSPYRGHCHLVFCGQCFRL